jgi:hypothetical protein
VICLISRFLLLCREYCLYSDARVFFDCLSYSHSPFDLFCLRAGSFRYPVSLFDYVIATAVLHDVTVLFACCKTAASQYSKHTSRVQHHYNTQGLQQQHNRNTSEYSRCTRTVFSSYPCCAVDTAAVHCRNINVVLLLPRCIGRYIKITIRVQCHYNSITTLPLQPEYVMNTSVNTTV